MQIIKIKLETKTIESKTIEGNKNKKNYGA
jgi:hypothetical protein